MSTPTKFVQRTSSEAQEDCRDFLRTGRCKYGASCKYNHPANVQSGGGVKAPVDPSEPPFPVRPDEPTCQYYMKHGTCKFGQACKFHHPPQSEMAAALLGGNAVLMNVGRNNEGASQQIVLNSISGTSAMALQFLPQRPDEPDCIYFLRNGRCKYGATCRYHHPVAFHQGKLDVRGAQPRRQQQQHPDLGNGMNEPMRSNSTGHLPETIQGSTQYIRTQHSSSSWGQPGRQRMPGASGGAPTHFVVTETPLAVMGGNAPGSSNSYHRIVRSNSGGMGEDYSVPLNTSGGTGFTVPQDYTSSSSSIASSYETATSVLEYLPSAVQQDPSSGIWTRPVRRVGSGGSLNAFDSAPQLRPQAAYGGSRTGLAPSGSDNSIASRPLRAESLGSGSDSSAAYQDAWNSSSNSQATAGRAWMDPNSSFEQSRRLRNPHFSRGERKMPQDSGRSPRSMQGGNQDSSNESHNDEGLSMMTSALLNMLDTPEEAAMKSYTSRDPQSIVSPPSTPRRGPANTYSPAQEKSPVHDRIVGSAIARREQTSRYYFTANEYTHDVVPEDDQRGLNSTYSPAPRLSRDPNNQADQPPTWSPTWPGPASPSRHGLEENAQSMSVLQQRPSGSGSGHPSSNIGLYLS